ncbi:MAG: hypothetical protein ABEH59_11850 [Halobacteriales archaeon]
MSARGLLFVIVDALGGLGAVSLGLAPAGVLLALLGVSWAAIAVLEAAIVTRLAPTSDRVESLGVYTAIIAVPGGVGGVLCRWVATIGYPVASEPPAGCEALARSSLRRCGCSRGPRTVPPRPSTNRRPGPWRSRRSPTTRSAPTRSPDPA